jgi:hypothetical protein
MCVILRIKKYQVTHGLIELCNALLQLIRPGAAAAIYLCPAVTDLLSSKYVHGLILFYDYSIVIHYAVAISNNVHRVSIVLFQISYFYSLSECSLFKRVTTR